MFELHALTIDWARERGILDNGKATTQALKLGSEFGELCWDLAANKDIDDDIGDCLVVCTNLANILGLDLIQILDTAPIYHTTPRVPTAASYLGDIQDLVIKNKDVTISMRNFVNQLEGIAKTRHTSLIKGWKAAYEDIKDRKGYLNEHGNFIKDQ